MNVHCTRTQRGTARRKQPQMLSVLRRHVMLAQSTQVCLLLNYQKNLITAFFGVMGKAQKTIYWQYMVSRAAGCLLPPPLQA